jgi:hypothetical protein
VGACRFDHRADVTAIGLVALSLVLGRPIGADEYPHRIGQLLNDARARTAGMSDQPLPDALHNWIARALQLDPRQGFTSASDAQVALEDALADDSGFVAAPVALETFLSRYIAAMLDPLAPAPVSFAPPLAAAPPAARASVTPPPVAQTPIAPPPPAPAPVVQTPIAAAAPAPTPAPVVQTPIAPAPPAPPSFAPAAAAPIPPISFAPVAPPTSTPAVVPPAPAPIAAAPPVPPPAPAPIVQPIQPVSVLKAPEPAPLPVVPAPRVEKTVPAASHAPARDINELLGDFGVPTADAPEPLPEFAIPAPPRARAGGWRRIAALAVLGVVLAGGGIYAWTKSHKVAAPMLGTLSVQTNPPGAAVFVDGVSRGNTPARLSLNAGAHIVELRGRGVPRVIPVTVTAGAEASQYLELPETPSTGSLLVQSDPAGARVSIDGVERGVAPVSVGELAPGEHEVVLQTDGAPAVKQRVVIQAGVTSSVLAPVATASAGPVSGWLSVKAPVGMEIREGGRLIGTTDSDRLMMAAGRHDVEIVNDTLGYRVTRSIQVPPGKVAAINVELPQGVLNVNAAPWAEVWIDGRRVGETPIGNLPISIGPHEIVFRHPQLGEKRQAVSVTLKAPVRLSVDMK